uniref:DNA-directed RNA polymerase subunit n=1 Tax=Meloidogyne incognita TaxID=6306 RepID=A0A914MNY7_MELIC
MGVMFQQNNDFCTVCGTILPLPELMPSTVQCALCKNKWPAKRLMLIKNEIPSPTNEASKKTQQDDDKNLNVEEDVTVEHLCPKCDYNVATYTTQQTRSADEGQTVFYQCVKCKHRCIEYS